MYPPAVARCQTVRRTTTDSAPSPKERDVAPRRKPREDVREPSVVAAGGTRAVTTRPRMLLRRHQVPPEPLARVRLGLDVLGVVRPADHHLDVPEQLVDVFPLLTGVEVCELPDTRLDPVHTALEPLVGRDRGL